MTTELEKLLAEINDDFEEHHAVVNRNLRIKHMPTGPGFRLRDLELYEKFLDSSPTEQAHFVEQVHPDEVEFFEQLLISRAEYEIAEQKSGSWTEDRVGSSRDGR